MPVVEYAVTINRPIGEVFRFVADFRNAPQWQSDVTEVHQTEGSTRVGSMVTEVRSTRLLGWKLDLNADITDFQLNKLLEYKGVLGRFPVTGTLTFEATRGATRVTHALNIRMGFLFALYSPLMAGVMRRRTQTTMDALRALMDSRADKPAERAPSSSH